MSEEDDIRARLSHRLPRLWKREGALRWQTSLDKWSFSFRIVSSWSGDESLIEGEVNNVGEMTWRTVADSFAHSDDDLDHVAAQLKRVREIALEHFAKLPLPTDGIWLASAVTAH